MDDHCNGAPAQKNTGAEDLSHNASSQEGFPLEMESRFACDDASDARIVALKVEGMGCVNCAARVHNALRALEGVVSVDVDWERGLALVDYVPLKTDVEALVRAIASASEDGRHIYRAQVITSKENL